MYLNLTDQNKLYKHFCFTIREGYICSPGNYKDIATSHFLRNNCLHGLCQFVFAETGSSPGLSAILWVYYIHVHNDMQILKIL